MIYWTNLAVVAYIRTSAHHPYVHVQKFHALYLSWSHHKVCTCLVIDLPSSGVGQRSLAWEAFTDRTISSHTRLWALRLASAINHRNTMSIEYIAASIMSNL